MTAHELLDKILNYQLLADSDLEFAYNSGYNSRSTITTYKNSSLDKSAQTIMDNYLKTNAEMFPYETLEPLDLIMDVYEILRKNVKYSEENFAHVVGGTKEYFMLDDSAVNLSINMFSNHDWNLILKSQNLETYYLSVAMYFLKESGVFRNCRNFEKVIKDSVYSCENILGKFFNDESNVEARFFADRIMKLNLHTQYEKKKKEGNDPSKVGPSLFYLMCIIEQLLLHYAKPEEVSLSLNNYDALDIEQFTVWKNDYDNTLYVLLFSNPYNTTGHYDIMMIPESRKIEDTWSTRIFLDTIEKNKEYKVIYSMVPDTLRNHEGERLVEGKIRIRPNDGKMFLEGDFQRFRLPGSMTKVNDGLESLGFDTMEDLMLYVNKASLYYAGVELNTKFNVEDVKISRHWVEIYLENDSDHYAIALEKERFPFFYDITPETFVQMGCKWNDPSEKYLSWITPALFFIPIADDMIIKLDED